MPTAPTERPAWAARQALLLTLTAAGLLALFEGTDLDLRIARRFFDAGAGGFPLQHHWLFERLLHHGLKYLLVVATLFALALCVAAVRDGNGRLPPCNAWVAGLGLLLIPLATVILKQLTNKHCPWDVAEFGGYAPYLELLAGTPEDLVRGVCFPAGHASGGFAWMVWGAALRPLGRRPAAMALAGGFALGLPLGWARMAQGAHFLSHVLWSAWLAWAITVALCLVLKLELRSKRS
ncbi:MAG: phosphatase PAP2 family protein [Pseudomonadota bacterium]|jgi:membrane-associated PAP2 superfamily phosphatase